MFFTDVRVPKENVLGKVNGGWTIAKRLLQHERAGLAAEIQNNPERLAVACDQMNDKAAAMNLALAEAWMKKGQEKEALACLEKVVKLSPNSPYAMQAQARMNAIRGGNPAVPTGFNKDP